MANRADKPGVLGYSWVYWGAITAAFALLIVDVVTTAPSGTSAWSYA